MIDSKHCLDSNTIVDLLEARLADVPAAGAREHLDRCDVCRQLLTAVTIAERSDNGTGDQEFDENHELPILGDEIGRYEVRRLVGYGGMGMVYAAHDPRLDRMVALKLLRPSSDDIEATQQALERESKIMAGLTSSNVATIYDIGEWRGRIYLALELAEAGNLTNWLQAGRSWQEIRDAFVAAGNGLAAAHDVGVVHGDFKPDNLLMTKDGEVRVADFGLARLTSELHQAGAKAELETDSDSRTIALVGTPAYMAPEQHRGMPATELTDQYSFCVALFEALYGTRPFVADSIADLAELVHEDEPTPPPRSKIPAWLFGVIRRGLQVTPQKRYRSMSALLDDLRRSRSSPWRWRLLASGLAVIGVLVVALWVVGNRPSAPDNATPFAPGGSCAALTETRPRGMCMSMTAMSLLGDPEGYAAAAALATEAVNLFHDLYGADHCDMMVALMVRSQARLESDPAGAEKDIVRVLDVCADGTDDTSDDVAGLRVLWAETLVELERFDDAKGAIETVNPALLSDEERTTLDEINQAIFARSD